MKKYVILGLISVFVIIISLFSIAIYISFTKIKPITDTINQKLSSQVISKIVWVPEGIQRPGYEFNQTTYFWEMETTSKEVTGVNFKYTPAFTKNEKEIVVTLEMPENGDASIFTKVLPAIVADEQSIKSALDPQKANLGASSTAHFSSIQLTVNRNNQTTKMVWIIPKENLPSDIREEYEKLNFPALKTLYSIRHFIISLFQG